MRSPLQRLLYVDDDPDIQIIASMALIEIGGLDLLMCSSGAEALTRYAGYAPQLLLLDVMMPGMDGPATLDALRRLPGWADTPAVFVTAKVRNQERQRYLDLGAVEVIPKPFDPMTLADQLRAVWMRLPER
jgi:two-component system OmpR family response regulator